MKWRKTKAREQVEWLTVVMRYLGLDAGDRAPCLQQRKDGG